MFTTWINSYTFYSEHILLEKGGRKLPNSLMRFHGPPIEIRDHLVEFIEESWMGLTHEEEECLFEMALEEEDLSSSF